MDRYTNFFELHVGFAREGPGEDAPDEFLERMNSQSADWTKSVVNSVYITKPGCVDPHNVPGTLGWLVSKRIFLSEGSWKNTINRLVVPACSAALEQLSRQESAQARLEIEFPFACFEASVIDGKLTRSVWAEDPVSIDADHLLFSHGTPLPEVPKWEIHFLFDRITDFPNARPLPVDQVAEFLCPYGIDAEQTIEYRSQSMVNVGRNDYRLISTSYYPNAKETQKEAERIFYETTLSRDVFRRGYVTRLIPEHIITCLRPNNHAKGSVLSESLPTSHAR